MAEIDRVQDNAAAPNRPQAAKAPPKPANEPPRVPTPAMPAVPGTPATPAEIRTEPEVNKLFRMVMKFEGSDLHLKVGQPPMMRLKGLIRRMDAKPLSQEDMERLLLTTLTADLTKILNDTGGVDYSYVIGNEECRFRVNLFKQRGTVSLVARRLNTTIPLFEKLCLR